MSTANVSQTTGPVSRAAGCVVGAMRGRRHTVSPVPVRKHSTTVLPMPEPQQTSPVVAWSHVAELSRVFEGDMLCVALGVVGLQAVNADFCRGAGDHAVAQFHRRLRDAGGVDCIVERIGGTQFLALLPSGGSDRLVVQRFLSVARRPIAGPYGEVVLGCAAGVSIGGSRSPLVVFDRAVRNLEHALRRGAGSSEWTETPTRVLNTPARLAAPLLEAIMEDQIVAAFQPVVSLLAGDTIEYEALARWPGHDEVSPRCMVELARDMGVLSQFRTCVLGSIIELLRHRLDSESVRRVSINVSAAELVPAAFPASVISLLEEASVAASSLQIEITDAISDSDYAAVSSNIDILRGLGVRIALDGLADGAVDWKALMRLDIDAIKVESDLLVPRFQSGRAGASFRSVLELATEFGLDVVAKGIETIEQHERLVSSGCLFGQGSLYSGAVSREAVDAMFATRVQNRWSEVACSNRSLHVSMDIGNQDCAPREPVNLAAWPGGGRAVRRPAEISKFRSCSMPQKPIRRQTVDIEVHPEDTDDVQIAQVTT